jgi:phage shock protein A
MKRALLLRVANTQFVVLAWSSATMDDAIKKVRQLAASALARKERLNEQLAALEAEQQQRTSERELAISADDDEVALHLTQQLNALSERMDLKRGEVAEAESSYLAIVGDLRAVQDAAKEHERLAQRAPVDALAARDEFSPSAEDAALENVRRHIENLSAEAELNDDLGAARKSDRELEQKIARLEKEEAEAKAKAQLAELKAKKKAASSPSPGETPPAKKPKKTM